MEAIKQFLQWITVKEKLHSYKHIPPLFKEGEVWWCAVGENVGIEINGKSSDFTRPVLIFKKFSQYGFCGIPLSTQIKEGTWYVEVLIAKKKAVIVLSQARSLSSNRLHSKLGE